VAENWEQMTASAPSQNAAVSAFLLRQNRQKKTEQAKTRRRKGCQAK